MNFTPATPDAFLAGMLTGTRALVSATPARVIEGLTRMADATNARTELNTVVFFITFLSFVDVVEIFKTS
jgi:hypothetical protein